MKADDDKGLFTRAEFVECIDISYKNGRSVGIREVVDWINEHAFDGEERHPDKVIPSKVIHLLVWQTKLKEWGIGSS